MDRKALIDALNEDLAGELSAVIQYITYAAKATGPYRPQLAAFFLEEVADEQLHVPLGTWKSRIRLAYNEPRAMLDELK